MDLWIFEHLASVYIYQLEYPHLDPWLYNTRVRAGHEMVFAWSTFVETLQQPPERLKRSTVDILSFLLWSKKK